MASIRAEKVKAETAEKAAKAKGVTRFLVENIPHLVDLTFISSPGVYECVSALLA